ncbi:Fpg/Nei family DNA glycosylase [Kineococcus rhizosphaerae]|uniref:Formamidopyrimidine-DNA glycosylase n=1 Tax=Kineococcus rhizosphaerae TaxID=559628 RepID=A0A2T0QWZ0_9ACTN|nr:DNA-formamidopyrimidine glycosylase family protein [Kineococcus rhizosphaerae]PRY10076.1 formamidopyrimidine-DNA glycosylase [Kineococcus rhizosphaerae]
MPELPEVETARAAIEAAGLHREIADVDDTDTFECRPHAPGDLKAALVGRTLTAAHRRGKSMWCDTSGDGPALGIHLGMSGRVFITDPGGRLTIGGDYGGPRPETQPDRDVWYRFSLYFADGGSLRLRDKRRLGRVRLDPDLGDLGPDAELVGREEFRARVGRGTAPLKARIMDQSVLAGVGNLLADETLWRAGLSPLRPAGELRVDELDHLRRELRGAIRHAVKHGGVHTGEVVPHRRAGDHCPRCGGEMVRATVGGRTTWWCSAEQTLP